MEEALTDEEIFSTRDLTEAATMVSLKFPLVGIDYQLIGRKPNPIGFFKFEKTPLLKEARQKYMQSLITVEPKLFMTNVHALKAEVTNFITNPHNTSF